MRQYQILLSCALLATGLSAQQTKTVPPGFGLVPGNSKLTYPFGRPTGGVQVIIDAPWITAGTATLTGMRLRPDDTTTKSYVGYTKTYKVDVATTTVSAAGMTTAASGNLAGAAVTMAFKGPLNLPSYGPAPRAPAPFSVVIPFLAPYSYDSTKGSFLFSLESTDLAPASSSWPVDSVTLSTSKIGGLATKLGDGCSNGQDSLTLGVDTTNLVVGNALNLNLTTTSSGAFPTGFVFMGLRPQNLDLTVLGMAGCWLQTSTEAMVVAPETGTGYPPIQVPIPNQPALEGSSLIVQALGWRTPQGSSLSGSVVTNAYGVRVGAAAGQIVQGQCIFSKDLNSWYMAKGSVYMPVVQLIGTF